MAPSIADAGAVRGPVPGITVTVVMPFMVPVLVSAPVLLVGVVFMVVTPRSFPVQSMVMTAVMAAVMPVSGLQRAVVLPVIQADAVTAVSLGRARHAKTHGTCQQGRTDECADFHGAAPFGLSQ
jgi:hypothetical protein